MLDLINSDAFISGAWNGALVGVPAVIGFLIVRAVVRALKRMGDRP